MTKNFQVTSKEDGNKYWVSRSVVACPIVYYNHNGDNFNPKILIAKRGQGAAGDIGRWNIPVGFLEYGETLEECAAREIFEETGYVIDKEEFELIRVNSSPSAGPNEPVVAIFIAHLPDEPEAKEPYGGEPDEVSDIKWITMEELPNYDFAFNHEEVLKSVFIQF